MLNLVRKSLVSLNSNFKLDFGALKESGLSLMPHY